MKVGVVVPVRDEEDRLPGLLASVAPFLAAGDPVVVVDDGGLDRSAEIAETAGTEVIREPRRGRGQAVARGVEALTGRVDAILIAHADMVLPDNARSAIAASLSDSRVVGGALGHRIDDARPVFRLVEWGNRFRAARLGLPYGDQAQFFRSGALGEFPRMARLEDLELALRLRRTGRVVYLDRPVRIPSRHWRGGVVRTTLRNLWTALRYRVQRGREIVGGESQPAP